jgi:hypothetical protein
LSAVVRKYDPERQILTYCQRIHRQAAANDDDSRLTEAQRYAAVVAVLKCDPAILVARQINLLMDHKSKLRSRWKVDPYTLHKMIVDLHNLVSPSPDYRTRRRDPQDNQFELDFAWHVEGDSRVAGLPGAAE